MNELDQFDDLKIYDLKVGDLHGYLLSDGKASVLIDGPAENLSERCREAGVPEPKTILHTNVKSEFFESDRNLLSCISHVPAGSEYLCTKEPALKPKGKSAQQFLDEWADLRGEDEFGIMGCEVFPCIEPVLPAVESLHAGQSFEIGSSKLEVIETPSHGKYACSFRLTDSQGDARALFTGGLLKRGGVMVNYYDCEWNYGLLTGLKTTLVSLDALGDYSGLKAYPAYGEVINETKEDVELLKVHVQLLLDHNEKKTVGPTLERVAPATTFGNYAKVGEGIYNMTSGGNTIYFIDDEGDALVIDPGPCYYESQEAFESDWQRDFELFEKEAGLKRVDEILVTHMHGDHVDGIPLMQKKYGSKVRCPEIVAEVISDPRAWNLPALAPDYEYGIVNIGVDEVLELEREYTWKGVTFHAFDLPGHCRHHVGYTIQWKGKRVTCVGDYFFANEDDLCPNVVVVHNHSDEDKAGYPTGIEHIIAQKSDLIVTAHSTAFYPRDSDLQSFKNYVNKRRSLFQNLAGSQSLSKFMLPPSFKRA